MIELRGLTKVYGPTKAVDDLSFTVKPGIVTGFLGPNGAGKSTTMRMILGLDQPTSGAALIDGKPYRELKTPLRTVGALLDAKWVHPNRSARAHGALLDAKWVHPNRSARAHLQWMAASNGIPKSRVDEVLGLVGLSEVAGKKAGGFSLGMSQRLGLAGALLGDPKVLLFDEPVNGLDPEGIVWIRKFMQRLAAEGRTVLVSSHLLSEMALTAEQLVVIGRGRLISDSTVAEFVDRSSESTVRVRSPQLDALHAALTAHGLTVREEHSGSEPVLVVVDSTTDAIGGLAGSQGIVLDSTTDAIGGLAGSQGIVLHELASVQGSLEDAFMKLTGDDVQYHASGIDPGAGAHHTNTQHAMGGAL
ncbi:ABC transporter ATP-binding protein [Rhodococcus erythropolis]|uniref:ATP-binding cassette domain-containing protein n=11 Tax=Nocardiaceae TaxID=85025 RepID=A0AAX3VBF0_RHOER|nr:ATP-binding cassette domain-containing protein [Rhodococcus erythropolis]WGV52326.2 ATP-binding cassette domain-containing protein [Rhodococcus erythropolis]